jgi:hypothetical protein
MTTVDRLYSNSQTYPQLSQYVALLQSCMMQQSNVDVLGVHLKLTLKQEKQISRQGFRPTTIGQH